VLPGLTAIGCFEEPAIAARSPQRTLSGDVNVIRVAWIECDAANALGCFQADVLPGSAAVIRAINAVAIRHAALAVVFACSHPNRERVFRIDPDRADRIRAFVVEDRSPGGSCVGSLPHPARGSANEIASVICGINRDAAHASRG